MSAVSAVNCPVCRAKQDMQEDDDDSEVFYYCWTCGYGNLFSHHEDGSGYSWPTASERNRFVCWVNITRRDRMLLTGRVPFEPLECRFTDEHGVFPTKKGGSLAWRLYSLKGDRKHRLLGEFSSAAEAFGAGDEYIKRPKGKGHHKTTKA